MPMCETQSISHALHESVLQVLYPGEFSTGLFTEVWAEWREPEGLPGVPRV